MPALLLVCALTPAVLAADDAPGRRIDLGGATLFVPDGFRAEQGKVDVLLHLHGAASVVEPAFVAAGWPGVLIEFQRNGLSSVYTAPFRDAALFPALLDRAMKALAEAKFADDPRPGRVVVSTFSAGFGGLRELLKVPEHAARIDAVVMADSLYCGYEGDPKDHKVDAALMAPFRRFAARAVEGEKTFVLTHSSQVPEGYASTTETATDLIAHTGAEAVAAAIDWGPDWEPIRRARKSRFEALGFGGVGPDDHMRHLRQIARIWAEARRILDGR